MPQIKIKLSLFKSKENKIEKDIFKDANFWLSKGLLIQTKGVVDNPSAEVNSAALDYYLSGVKIDPRHYGCVYNAACSYFNDGKFTNALKWFEIASKIDPQSQDSHFGKSVTCLKLGQYSEALEVCE